MNPIDPPRVHSHNHRPPFTEAGPKQASSGVPPRPKRPKTSKACNACRKQKSRCERLVGDTEGCHRCDVIGIPCVFDSESPPGENAKIRRPRTILPQNHDGLSGSRLESSDHSRLHILANTTALVSREEPRSVSSRSLPSHQNPLPPHTSVTAAINSPLSPETVSTVESTLFTTLHPQTAETESKRFRLDWKRWIAPLTYLQTLIRRRVDRENGKPPDIEQDGRLLSPAEEVKVKNYFFLKYAPWLPSVSLGTNGNKDSISPFLSAVICATAARTFGGIAQSTLDRLRSLALHRIGYVLSNPLAHPLIETLYALLILIMWPLDAAADVTLLVHSAKSMASNGKFGMNSISDNESSNTDKDHKRLYHSICANEIILTMGAGGIGTSPDVNDFNHTFGTGSQIALRHGKTSDVLLALEIKLLKIVTAAMSDRPVSYDKDVSQSPEMLDTIYSYISRASMFRTNLIEWEIDFYTIKGECNLRDEVYYALLEIEYHYLFLVFIQHATLTISHACPVFTAPEDIRTILWSWCTTLTKSGLTIVRLFNTYAIPDHDSQSYNLPPFAVAPDRMFATVVIAIMLLLRQQVHITEYARRLGAAEPHTTGGFTRQGENSVRKAVGRMKGIGHVQGASTMSHHPAAKYVEILEALLRCWDRKREPNASSFPPESDLTMRHQTSGSGVGGGAVGVNAGTRPLGHMDHNGTRTVQWDNDMNVLGGDFFSDHVTAFNWEESGGI